MMTMTNISTSPTFPLPVNYLRLSFQSITQTAGTKKYSLPGINNGQKAGTQGK